MEIIADFIIYGEPASKSNSRQIVYRGKGKSRRPISIKSKKALAYAKEFQRQAAENGLCCDELHEGDITLIVEVWYRSRRPDLEVELIKDLLQGIVYKNDRQVKTQLSFAHSPDKDNPRVRCRIVDRPLEPQEVLKIIT